MRTTIDIDDVVLREAKARAAEEGKTLGRLVSELLGRELRNGRPQPVDFVWHTTNSPFLVDIEDKDALWRVLDAHE